MKLSYKYFAFLFAGALALTSCDMEELPTNAVVVKPGESLIKSDLELNALRMGLYKTFRGTFYGSPVEIPELMCDGFNALTNYGNNYGPIHRQDKSFTASDQDCDDLWASHYGAMKNYNVFLDNAAALQTDDEKFKANVERVAAEARFFRACSYLTLVRHYAEAYDKATADKALGVPLVLTYDQEAKPARATVAEVYKAIFDDLTLAAEKLGGEKGYSAANSKGSIDVNIEAINFMFARYYLDTQNYAKAKEYAENLITCGIYGLADNSAAMMNEYYYDKGTEAVMQLAASATENGSGTNNIWIATGYNKNYGGVYYAPYYAPSKKLIDLYDKSTEDGGNYDLRYENWFDGKLTYAKAFGVRYNVISGKGVAPGSMVDFTKFYGNPDLNTNGVPNNRQHVKPFMIGEAYLIAAEAAFKAGQADDATEILNMLQEARGAKTTAATKETILTEWFKETVGEGHRFTSLKRWGEGFEGREAQTYLNEKNFIMGGDAFVNKVMKGGDFRWTWPIPSYEMRVNSNLVQNNGY